LSLRGIDFADQLRSAVAVKWISPAQYESVLRENAALREQVASLTGEIAKLSLLVAQSNERIAELLAVVGRNNSRGKSRPPAPPPLPPPSLDPDAKAAFDARPKAPELPAKPATANKPRRPTGRKAVPEHLHAEEHRLAPDACESCGSNELDMVDELVEIKLHVVKEHMRRRVVHRKTCACRRCGARTTPRSLPSPFARSKATCEWLAWLVHQKFVMLTPLDRLRRDLASKGVPLAMSFLVGQIERAADLLDGIDGAHWKQLLASDWMATDATGLKVLIPGLEGSHNGHLEVYRNDEQVVFQYEPHKGGEVLAAKLASFKGTLVADAEHRHNAVFADGSVKEAGCNAHGRRKFRDAEQAQPALAAEGGAFIANIYLAEAQARKAGLRGDALRVFRQSHISPLRDALLRWMDAVEPSLLPDDALGKAIRYYRNHWEALFRFVDHPEVPIDNSASEREYQNVAKLRLNSLFAGSTEGAHRAAVLLGIAATCRNLGIDTQAYLAWAFTRLGTHRDLYGLSAVELTPAAYARAGPH
jgi:transposase